MCEVKHAQQFGDLGISVYFLWMLCGFLTLIASMLFLWHRAFVLWKRLVTYWQNVLGNVACRGHQRGFVPPWGEDGFAVGRSPGFEPLSLEVRGLAAVGTACKGGSSQRTRYLEGGDKGKSCLSGGCCSITRNEWILGQKPWKDIVWLGARLMQCRIPLTKAAVRLGVYFCCKHI